MTGTTIDARGAALFDDSRPTGRFGVIVVGAAFVLALATFLVFAGFTPILPTQTVVFTLLIGDGLVVLVLIVLIAIELARLRAARRAARAGARLHSRFVTLFSLVAAIPAIITAIVATVSVEWAINPRFMSDVAAFINEANQATQLYRESQCRALLRDVELTAGDIARSALLLRSDPTQFKEYFSSRSKTLGFTAAALMKSDGTPIVVAEGSEDKLIARLANIKTGVARRQFLRHHRSLLRSQIVAQLAPMVVDKVRVDTRQALHLAEAALLIARQLHRKEDLALALRAKGNALHLLGKNRAAVQHHERAFQIYKSLGLWKEAARTLSTCIQPLSLLGEYDRAFEAAERARDIFARLGEIARIASLDNNVANILYRRIALKKR